MKEESDLLLALTRELIDLKAEKKKYVKDMNVSIKAVQERIEEEAAR
jgi:hypothetical protein